MRYPYWFWKVTLQYLSTELLYKAGGRDFNQNDYQIEEMHNFKQGNMAIDSPDKREDIFNYSTLKTHKKILVSSTALPTITWTKKPISQVNCSTKILESFSFAMPLLFFVKLLLLAICGR